MPERAITSTEAPRTYAELRRGVEEALLTGQRRIEQAKVRTYWETGRLINRHLLLNNDRAAYGAQVIPRLARDLEISDRVLYRCVAFVRAFPILTGRSELTWAHYRVLCEVADDVKRKALTAQALKADWTSTQLEERVRALNLLQVEAEAKAAGSADSVPPAKLSLLTPKRGTPGLHRVVVRDDGLAVDLGFKLYRPLAAGAKWRAGDIVRFAADGGLRGEPDATPADLFTYAARVRRVVDGDTLVVEIDVAPDVRLEIKLRLRGLDCPELATPEGRAAKRFVEARLAAGDAATIGTTKPDKYDRYLADVFVGGAGGGAAEARGETEAGGAEIFLNNALLENGQAVRFEGSWPE